jgi:hypothetical protein
MRVLNVVGGAFVGAASVYLFGIPLPPLVIVVLLAGGVSMIVKGRKEG